ncbi:LIRP-like [Tigriopus californicus]|nr:LIRP-like [Tigriopus californicus]
MQNFLASFSKSPLSTNFVFLLFLLTWSWAQASAEFEMANFAPENQVGSAFPVQLMAKRNRIRLCGNHLANAIKITCFVKQNRGKRSVDTVMNPLYNGIYKPRFDDPRLDNEWQQAEAQAEQANLMPRPSFGSSYQDNLPERFRTISTLEGMNKRGAADDCCLTPCTMSHLETFC